MVETLVIPVSVNLDVYKDRSQILTQTSTEKQSYHKESDHMKEVDK